MQRQSSGPALPAPPQATAAPQHEKMTAINPRSNRRIFGEEDDSIEPMGRATLKRRSQNILSDAAKAVDEEEFMSPLLKRASYGSGRRRRTIFARHHRQ